MNLLWSERGVLEIGLSSWIYSLENLGVSDSASLLGHSECSCCHFHFGFHPVCKHLATVAHSIENSKKNHSNQCSTRHSFPLVYQTQSVLIHGMVTSVSPSILNQLTWDLEGARIRWSVSSLASGVVIGGRGQERRRRPWGGQNCCQHLCVSNSTVCRSCSKAAGDLGPLKISTAVTLRATVKKEPWNSAKNLRTGGHFKIHKILDTTILDPKLYGPALLF